MSEAKIIREIERVRRHNNRLWITLLKIALESAPIKTKSVLKGITKNDLKITKLVGQLWRSNRNVRKS